MDESVGPPRSALLSPADIRQLAARLGVNPSKRLGQNFVIDAGTIRRIVALAELTADDVVLEVGPGLGSLTLGLIEAAGRVTAVEIDPVLAAELPVTVASRAPVRADRLTVVTADAVTLSELPGNQYWPAGGRPPAPSAFQPTTLVANLPYNVAVPVLLNLLEAFPSIARALVMVQAEVADRICAPPGSRTYGIPSVKVAWYGTARRAGSVSRTVFWPVPNVDSALVSFTRRVEGDRPEVDRVPVFEVIDAAFAQRRKTLRAALASWAGSADAAQRVLDAAGVDPAVRGETIDVTQYIRIAQAAAAARSIIESWRA